MDYQKIINSLQEIISTLKLEMEKQINPVPVVPDPVPVVPDPVPVVISQTLLDLLKSDEWPEAVDPTLICDESSEEQKFLRAEGIVNFLESEYNISDRKILDFGCGEGHIISKASEKTKKSIGYDITKTGKLDWEQESEKLLLTTEFTKVKQFTPFDLIFAHDVLDHCIDPIAALKEIATVCNQNTRVIVRCHSWMSRHGAHLYKTINKAWVHLIFTEQQLEKMGYKYDFVQKYYFPLQVQGDWFAAGGFKIVSSNVTETVVEPFFKRKEFIQILGKEFKGEFPRWQMSQSFNDYVLALK